MRHLEESNGGFGASSTWSICSFVVLSRCDSLGQLTICTAFLLWFVLGKGENATTWAKLYPDTHFESGGYCEAANAIDGRTNIGESGAVTVLNCASTMSTRQWRNLQYLQIDLQRPYSIAAIRLHLRDGEQRRRWQNGLVVIVSNSTIGRSQTNVGTQCGVAYNPSELGQSPLFPCWASGRYVYAALRHRALYPVQVCEMQIFKGLSRATIL